MGTQPPTTNTSPTTTNHSNKQLILLRQATSIKNNKHDFVISLNNKFYSTPPSTINYIIHTKLRDSSRWNRPRGPSSTFYQFLEDDHSTPMATIGDSRWVQDTICETTNSLETTSTNTICRRPIASQHSCPKIFDRGNDRSFTDSKQELPFKFLYIEGTDEASANFRLPKTQQFHPSRAFQNGRGAGTARTHRKRRLHLQNRFKRCIRSHTYTPRFSRLSKLRKPRYCLSIQIPSIRAQCRPSRFLKNNEICYRTITKGRSSYNLLSRRYLSTRKNQRKHEDPHYSSHSTSTKLRVHHQLQQEHPDTNEDSRFPRLSIQYKEDGNFGAQLEDQQLTKANQTSRDVTTAIIQMDSQLIGEDDSNDPSGGGSIASYPLPAERFITSSSPFTPELGNNMQLVLYRPPRLTVVENVSNKEERLTNSEDKTGNSKGQHLCRRFEYRLGNKLTNGHNIWVLDTRGSTTFNKRKRIEDDFVCNTTPRKRLCKLDDEDILRQHNSTEVHNKIRGNFIIDSTRHSNTNTEYLQQLQSSSLPTRTRHTKHSSGQAEQNPETVVRIIDPKSNVQENQSTMGPTTSGRICGQTQPTTTNILVSELGPGGDSDRCLPARLENQRSLPLPTMEDDSTSITTNQKTTT